MTEKSIKKDNNNNKRNCKNRITLPTLTAKSYNLSKEKKEENTMILKTVETEKNVTKDSNKNNSKNRITLGTLTAKLCNLRMGKKEKNTRYQEQRRDRTVQQIIVINAGARTE